MSWQDVYSDSKVDMAAINACLNGLAKWRRDAMRELQQRRDLMRQYEYEDSDVQEEYGAIHGDVHMDAEAAAVAEAPPLENDVPEDERWA